MLYSFVASPAGPSFFFEKKRSKKNSTAAADRPQTHTLKIL
jgi:hypothetical protein